MTKMVDIGGKDNVKRVARASGFIELDSDTVDKVENDNISKGDVISVSKTAGVMAIKNTTQIVPLTHPIPITGADVDISLQDDGIRVEVEVKSRGQTGVEMEALTGVNATLLTIWDMVKGFEKDGEGQYPDTKMKNISVDEKVKK